MRFTYSRRTHVCAKYKCFLHRQLLIPASIRCCSVSWASPLQKFDLTARTAYLLKSINLRGCQGKTDLQHSEQPLTMSHGTTPFLIEVKSNRCRALVSEVFLLFLWQKEHACRVQLCKLFAGLELNGSSTSRVVTSTNNDNLSNWKIIIIMYISGCTQTIITLFVSYFIDNLTFTDSLTCVLFSCTVYITRVMLWWLWRYNF